MFSTKWLFHTLRAFACTAGLAAAASGTVHGKEGGSSGNGDGAVWLKHWWSFGSSATWPENYPQAVSDFSKKHPTVPVYVCRKNPLVRFPVLTEQEAKAIGLDGTSEFEQFCSSRSLGETYGAFVILMIDQVQKDEIATYLMKRAFEKRPIQVVIEASPRLSKAQGGYTLDSSWVEKGILHWGPQPRDRRSPLATFRHELVHVVQGRAVGGTIATPSPAHDVRYGSDAIFNATILQMSTSQEAAFVEGFATALEYPFERTHAQRMWSVPNDLSEREGQLCYTKPWLMGEVDGKFGGPFKSEKYVASTVIRLLIRDGSYMGAINTQRTKWVIDALSSPEIIGGVDGFAKAFDKASGTNLGNRWLREHYFRDYIQDTNTFSEFTKVEKELFLFQERKYTYCTDVSNADKFLSPLLQKEDEVATALRQAKQEAELAAKVAQMPSNELSANAKKVSDNARWALVNNIGLPGVTIEQVISKQKAISAKIGNCALDPMQRPGKPDSFFDIIHARLKIVTKGSYDLPWEGIVYLFLDEGCADQSKHSSNVLKDGLQRLDELQAAETTPGTPEHLGRYKEIEETSKKFDSALPLLRSDYYLVGVLEDANADGSFNLVMLGRPAVKRK